MTTTTTRGGGGTSESFPRVHWVAVPKAMRARRVNRRSAGLVHGSQFRLEHVLSSGTLQVVRKPGTGKKGVAVARGLAELPAGGLPSKQPDCVSVTLNDAGFAPPPPLGANVTEGSAAGAWSRGSEAALFFCASRMSLSLEPQLTRWLPEVVLRLPWDVSDDELSAALAELTMGRQMFQVAVSHYSRALQQRGMLASQAAVKEAEAKNARAAKAQSRALADARRPRELPTGWAEGKLPEADGGTAFYYPVAEPTKVQFEFPPGGRYLDETPEEAARAQRREKKRARRRKAREARRRKRGGSGAGAGPGRKRLDARARVHARAATPTHLLHFKRAIVRTHLGRPHEAIWDLEQALAHSPAFLEALLYRARICLTQGRWAEAAQGFGNITEPGAGAKPSVAYRARQYGATLANATSTLRQAAEALAVARSAYAQGGERCLMSDADRQVLLWALLTEICLCNVCSCQEILRRLTSKRRSAGAAVGPAGADARAQHRARVGAGAAAACGVEPAAG
jgi:hypothetical protein